MTTARNGNLKKITAEQAVEIAELREAGWSYRRLGLRYDVTPGAIHYQCLRQGAVSPKSTGPDRRMAGRAIKTAAGIQRRFTPEQDARILALRDQGLNVREIAEREQRALTSVRIRLMTLALHDEMPAVAA